MSSTSGTRLQIRVTDEVAEQVSALASHFGVSQSAIGSMLIVAGLARLGDALRSPDLGLVLQALQEAKVGTS